MQRTQRSKERLVRKTVKELKEVCKQQGLKRSGRKAELIARILSAGGIDGEDEENVDLQSGLPARATKRQKPLMASQRSENGGSLADNVCFQTASSISERGQRERERCCGVYLV